MAQSFNPKTAQQLWKLHEKLAKITSPKSKQKTAGSPKALSGAEG
jgi:hypothetical protein